MGGPGYVSADDPAIKYYLHHGGLFMSVVIVVAALRAALGTGDASVGTPCGRLPRERSVRLVVCVDGR